MKKALYASTALAAASLIAMASSDAFAQAAAPAPAQKLQVGIGGYMQQTIGYADQTGTSSAVSYKHFDQKNDSELYFRGSVNLDNGLTVAIDIQIEADADSSFQADETYLTVGNADVGTLYLGATNGAAFYLGVASPGAGIPNYDGTPASWIVAPSSANYRAPSTSGSPTLTGATDYNRIEYISPSILGFRVGGGYAPSGTPSTGQETQPLVNESDQTNAAIQWAPGDLGGFKPRVYAGWWRTTDTHTTTTDTYSGGADVTIGDWVVGGGYASIQNTHDSFAATAVQPAGTAMNVGIKYNPGPYAVAFTYAHGTGEDTNQVGPDDKLNKFMLGGEYILGPGVTLLGNVFRIVYTDQANAGQNNENAGWAVVSGLKIDF